MIEIEKLKEFGLTENQAKLLNFIMNSKNRSALTFKQINEFNLEESFYWELLDDLVNQNFLTIIKDSKPRIYQYNESNFGDKIKKQEKNYEKIQQDFEKLIKELEQDSLGEEFDLIKKFGFFQTTQSQLKLSKDQIIILNALFSKENDKIIPMTRTIKQIEDIVGPLNKKLKKHNIRYHLNNLKERGFIISRKDGRLNTYSPKDLLTILKNEKEYHQKIWENKNDRLQKIVYYFNNNQISDDVGIQETSKEIQTVSSDIEEKYQFIDFDLNTVSWVKDQMFRANEEIIFDFRLTIDRTELKLSIAEQFYKNLIELLNDDQKSNIKVKLLIYLDDWLLHKLESLYVQAIQLVTQGNLEFKVTPDTEDRLLKIILDNSTLIDFLAKHDFAKFDKIFKNKNEMSVKDARRMFEQVWERSLDIRDAMLEHTISEELDKTIKKSIKKRPPVYEFKKQPIIITGYEKVLSLNLNLINRTESEILTIGGPLIYTGEGSQHIPDTLKSFYRDFFDILIKKCNKGINVKILRNSLESRFKKLQNIETIKRQIQFIISLFPFFQMRQIDLPQYQFMIIDKRILLIFGLLESGRIKLIILTDSFIIDKFLLIFQNAWVNSLDFRLAWLTEQASSLRGFISDSFNKLDLQMTLPERGEMKIFDGKYTRHIVNYLLETNRNELYIFQSFSDYFSNNKDKTKEKQQFASLVLSYAWEVMKILTMKKMKAKIIASYLPVYRQTISVSDLKHSLELYPQYQIHFLPPGHQSNIIYAVYDNFITLVIGDLTSNNFQFLVINDINLREFYKTQFENSWNNSIDLRQIFYEYGPPKKKKIVMDSLNKYKLEYEYSSEEIRKLFPPI
ncbi:MAG: winged helix-turn-helix domain-containing protein [Candidatus Hodarchaeota archaeon]